MFVRLGCFLQVLSQRFLVKVPPPKMCDSALETENQAFLGFLLETYGLYTGSFNSISNLMALHHISFESTKSK